MCAMADYFEIDFLAVETKKSGDAIPLRYEAGGRTYIHVVDGGFQETGEKIIEHVKQHYGNPSAVDHVVVTHPDGDHTVGLRQVLEEFEVRALWMLRPWLYAAEIIDRFTNFTSVENLKRRLRELYPNLVALEEIANRKGIPILEPFSGSQIGQFRVLGPNRSTYLDLIVISEKTPEHTGEESSGAQVSLAETVKRMVAKVVNTIRAAWGDEIFSDEETSAENEMSVVQYANICDQKILLTGDAGRRALSEAADYALLIGVSLPGFHRVQIPHHGSRRNVSTEVLDRLFGPRLASKLAEGSETFTAICSSAKEDEDHPRKAVVRAFYHRGAKVIATEGQSIRTQKNAPAREGWVAVPSYPYPEEQEE
jgi:beta-lactamase superfamily II metal-dependent hydrolase